MTAPEDGIERDANGNPAICDCPDGPEHPCHGRGFYRPEMNPK